jgi:predicted permease
MDKLLQVLEMVLPVLVMIALGYLCKKKKFFDENGLHGLKSLISNITIPVVLFLAFYKANYSSTTIIAFVIVYICSVLALGFGYLTRKLIGSHSKLMPFLLSGFEAGMLGYALFALLVGPENRSYFATVDLGQTIFVYTIYLVLLTNTTGGKATLKGTVMSLFKNKAFIGVLLGILFGITGLGTIITDSVLGGIFTNVLDFIIAPTAGMILIIVGYDLSFDKKVFVPVIKTIALRLIIMTALIFIANAILFSLVPMNKTLQIALILLFALPSPFVIPMFADLREDGSYVSTTLSLNTLVTILIFIALAFFMI